MSELFPEIIVRTGLPYGFFIIAPQQHLTLGFPSIESLMTSISAPHSGF
jgi:hypothetical protein